MTHRRKRKSIHSIERHIRMVFSFHFRSFRPILSVFPFFDPFPPVRSPGPAQEAAGRKGAEARQREPVWWWCRRDMWGYKSIYSQCIPSHQSSCTTPTHAPGGGVDEVRDGLHVKGPDVRQRPRLGPPCQSRRVGYWVVGHLSVPYATLRLINDASIPQQATHKQNAPSSSTAPPPPPSAPGASSIT